MATYLIKPNQSVLDMALQLYGSLDNLVEICQLNGVTLTQEVPFGTQLAFDKSRQAQSTTASYLALNSRPVITQAPLLGPDLAGPVAFEQAEFEQAEFE